MKISSPSASGRLFGIAVVLSLLFVTYQFTFTPDAGDSDMSLTAEARSMCRDSSEPESVYHRKDGWSQEAVIISHINHYQEKLNYARGKLLYLHIVDNPVDKQLEEVKTVAFVLSYWQYQHLLYYRDTEDNDNSDLLQRV